LSHFHAAAAKPSEPATAQELENPDHDPPPIIVSEDGFRAVRKRRDGNRPLPLPPLIDPIRQAQRDRWKKLKAAPLRHGQMSEFQKKLWDNPYGENWTTQAIAYVFAHRRRAAKALATPVRQCHITQRRLPSFFLLPFELESKPPGSDHAKVKSTLSPNRLLDEALGKKSKPPSHSTYTLLSEQVLARLDQTAHQARGPWQLLVRPDDKITRGADVELEWTPGTGERVAEAIRTIIGSELRSQFETQDEREPVIVEYVNGATIEGDVACILSFAQPMLSPSQEAATVVQSKHKAKDEKTKSPNPREPKSFSDALQDLDEQISAFDEKTEKHRKKATDILYSKAKGNTHAYPVGATTNAVVPQLRTDLRYPPLRFPSMTIGDRAVPVYKLDVLLGPQKLQDLLQGTRFEGQNAAVVTHSPQSVKLQMALLKAQNYFATSF
jgi:hypothetical protein